MLSVRVKVFPYRREDRCVQRSVTMRESPVEASIGGKVLSEGVSTNTIAFTVTFLMLLLVWAVINCFLFLVRGHPAEDFAQLGRLLLSK